MSITDMILGEAVSWLGTPYHHQARIKAVGVDCAQLLVGVFVDALNLVPSFDVPDYPPDWMKHRSEELFLNHIQQHATEVEVPQPGDVALWCWGRCFAHGGIVMLWPRVIHADIRVGRVVFADASQGKLAEREVKFFRVHTSASNGGAA